MEAVGLRLPAWLDRASDLRAAVSLPVQLRTSRLEGRVNTPSHWTDTCMLMSSCRPPAGEGAPDWSPPLANGVVTGRGERRGAADLKGRKEPNGARTWLRGTIYLPSESVEQLLSWVSLSLSRLGQKCPLANVLTPFPTRDEILWSYSWLLVVVSFQPNYLKDNVFCCCSKQSLQINVVSKQVVLYAKEDLKLVERIEIFWTCPCPVLTS